MERGEDEIREGDGDHSRCDASRCAKRRQQDEIPESLHSLGFVTLSRIADGLSFPQEAGRANSMASLLAEFRKQSAEPLPERRSLSAAEVSVLAQGKDQSF